MTRETPPKPRTLERPPRTPKPVERPLDGGPVGGPEVWRTVDGVAFCHWDRWLLRLALDDKGGLAGLAWLLRERVTDPVRICDKNDAEALHLQMVDLQKRLARVGRTPETLLDDEERASVWLARKAVQRVWRSGPRERTRAMRDTPRRLLSQRAMRGHWASFPVSPAEYEASLRDVVGDTSNVPHWATGDLASRIESFVSLRVLVATPAERLALRRAAMTVIVGVMNDVDDSLAAMATCYGEIERAYLDDLRAFPARATLLRDLVEFATWEIYGLTQGVGGFLAGLDARDADAALRAIRRLSRELRAAFRVSHAVERLKQLRAAVPTARVDD